ncbi:conjugative transfer ATPase, PFL_4706 family protein [Shewanella sairae]|uniref:Conjugative transfer ATPase, PFL_4706 family protein n=1 Tax=Shewanella sairae TaxID=190310 RepID=A0ABQ4P6S7_9GAMM|nr:conjugative transfer ATPase [Shewanella sairae]MCL1130466.1 conjugative transfer ATPase [Shewanella sairae]GIU42836.1 conjugative transfer ATPase, PFL_4706 family protein [Shewanella sairae]
MLTQLSQKIVKFFNPNHGLTAPAIDYSVPPSFAAKLPWADIDKNGVTQLDDGRSVGAFFSINPVSTEDKHQAGLESILGNITNAFVTAGKMGSDIENENPWIFQLMARDIDDLANVVPKLKAKVRVDDAFSQAVLAEDEKHFALIGREQGIFSTKNRPFRGRSRQVFLAVYRWLPEDSSQATIVKNRKQLTSLQRYLLNPSSLSDHGVKISRASGAAVFDLLAPFLNPGTKRDQLSHRERFSSIDRDYTERLLQSNVTADVENGLWWFKSNNSKSIATRVVELDNWSSETILTGRLFGEVGNDSDQDIEKRVLFDDLPPGSMLMMTLVPQTSKAGQERIKKIKDSAVGGEPEIVECRDQCEEMSFLINKHALWRGQVAIYLQGESLDVIESHTETIRSVFDVKGLGAKFVDNTAQVAPLDAYFRWLPMSYQPKNDPKYWYCGFIWLEDMLRLSPLFGRSIGSGSEALTFFNRGGEPLNFDPLSDFSSNAHLNLFGPSGSGKSATLVGICLRFLAIHRPRMFIIEAGDSFGLLADYCLAHGLTVNKVSLKPGCSTSLAPFADAKHLVGSDAPQITSDDALLPERLNDNDNPDDEVRDILGELEIMARMMITGGEKRELEDYRRADSSMVRQALVNAANTCHANNVMVRPTHVREALLAFSTDSSIPPERQQRARVMCDSMAFFCEGLEGKIFNGEGAPWPEADVTIIDLGIYAKNGYEAQMATAYISLINAINGIAERDQFSGVPIVCLTDEAHLISTNVLLAPYATKIVKMWRKLSAWFWLATQDLKDFPAESRKMLNNAEWWILLNMSEDELSTLQQFKKLSENKLDLIRSMTSEKHKFKEGVVMGMDDKFLSRFTIVPPALYLALGETDGDAKKKREDFMNKHNCTALEAAMLKAASIEEGRVNYQGEEW